MFTTSSMPKLMLAALIAAMSSAAVAADRIDNWTNSNGIVWRTGDQSQCWRDGFWTPATAAAGCDGAIVAPAPTPAPAPQPMAETTAPAPAPAAMPVSEKVSYSADTFFDFDKAVLKPAGKQALDQLADKIYVEGKGKSDFRVDPKTCKGGFKARVACQEPNRRTVVEIVGSHMVMK